MNVYYQVFLPIFVLSCVVGLIVSFVAGRCRGVALPAILLAIGTVSVWAGLFIGSDFGYREWQSIPDPPPEAFADTAPIGALLFGWLPGGILCGAIFGFTRLLYPPSPKPEISIQHEDGIIQANVVGPPVVESSNPYQTPHT